MSAKPSLNSPGARQRRSARSGQKFHAAAFGLGALRFEELGYHLALEAVDAETQIDPFLAARPGCD